VSSDLHDPTGFLNQLACGLRECDTLSKRVLVAVSGGADSVALLRGLVLLQSEAHLELVIGHLNHQLRGPDSDADARWVLELGTRLGVHCEIGLCNVSSMSEVARHGLEGAARIARQQFLQATAIKHACDHILLAHTADDQAETILHHILRGTGLRGLAGIQSVSSALEGTPSDSCGMQRPLVRPLLSVNRQSVVSFLENLGQDFRTDATNVDTQFTRNRIRHDLLPLLEREFNPQVRQALLRLGAQANEVHSHESELAQIELNLALLEATPDHCRLSCSHLKDLPTHRIRECLVRLWTQQKWPRQKMGFRDWQRLTDLIQQSSGSENLPGPIQASRRNDLLVLRRLN